MITIIMDWYRILHTDQSLKNFSGIWMIFIMLIFSFATFASCNCLKEQWRTIQWTLFNFEITRMKNPQQDKSSHHSRIHISHYYWEQRFFFIIIFFLLVRSISTESNKTITKRQQSFYDEKKQKNLASWIK